MTELELFYKVDHEYRGGIKESNIQDITKGITRVSNFNKVKKFHEVFGHPVKVGGVEDISEERKALRLKLISEEFEEVKSALENGDLTNLSKELADLLYVVYGTGLEFGVDLDRVFARVHQSNMSKLCYSMEEVLDGVQMYRQKDVAANFTDNEDGSFSLIRESDGKILKGPNYAEPDLSDLKRIGIKPNIDGNEMEVH